MTVISRVFACLPTFSARMEEAKSAQRAALQLLQSISEASNDIRYRVLENWSAAHTGEKQNLEQATDNLTQILADHVSMRDSPSTGSGYVPFP